MEQSALGGDARRSGVSVSAIVPARDAEDLVGRCLDALRSCDPPPDEILVVDDGSQDRTAEVASARGARVLTLETPVGPAAARNRGACAARGDILFFTDADVRVHPDSVGVVLDALADPECTAVIGSYDDEPGHPGFLSQYKNLFHHYVHQTGREEAQTFWSGCGAVRRQAFLELGGFNEGYARPSIEDIEFGFRLRAAQHRIALRKDLLATHDKRWTLLNLVSTDVFRRGVPWIALMARDRKVMDDLNLSVESRLGTVATYALILLSIGLVATGHAFALAPLVAWIALAILIAPATPPRPSARETASAASAIVAVSAVGLAAGDPWTLPLLVPVVLVLWFERRFYRFFARHRGPRFAFCVVPCHLLFFAYSGVCIPLGILAHLRDRARALAGRAGPGRRRLPPLRPLEGAS